MWCPPTNIIFDALTIAFRRILLKDSLGNRLESTGKGASSKEYQPSSAGGNRGRSRAAGDIRGRIRAALLKENEQGKIALAEHVVSRAEPFQECYHNVA